MAAGGGLLGTQLVGAAHAAETTTISGTIVAKSGARIQQDEIEISGGGDFHSVNTDNEGRFEAEVPTNGDYRLAFYKADSRSDFEAVKNGAPHIYSFGYTSVGESPKDLGTIELPRAHLVDLRILKSSGEPFLGAQPGFRHDGWGENPSRVAINTEGYTVIEGATFTGAEFANEVTLEVEPPAGERYSSRTYTYPISVDEPMTVTAVLDSSGVDWTAQTTAAFTGETPEQTTTATAETTTTTTAEQTTTIETTTASTTQSTPATQPTTTTTRNTTQSTTTTASRGFLSNDGPDSDVSILTNPFYLTVGGFVLSVSGIAHQMLRGY